MEKDEDIKPKEWSLEYESSEIGPLMSRKVDARNYLYNEST